MAAIHGFVFQRDLTRLFCVDDTRTKDTPEYSAESLDSLLKTIFFKQERIKLVKELVVLKYKSAIIRKEQYMPQLIQYSLQFSLNVESLHIKQQLYRLKLKLKTKHIVQINKLAIEEFLLNNQKQLNAKHVTIEIQLGQETTKHSKYNLVIFSKIKNLNIKK